MKNKSMSYSGYSDIELERKLFGTWREVKCTLNGREYNACKRILILRKDKKFTLKALPNNSFFRVISFLVDSSEGDWKVQDNLFSFYTNKVNSSTVGMISLVTYAAATFNKFVDNIVDAKYQLYFPDNNTLITTYSSEEATWIRQY